jgi:predicted DNA-binding transcriptional regulator YafY
MESEILCDLLKARGTKRRVELKIFIARHGKPSVHTAVPLKIYVSTQNARRYLLAYNYRAKRIIVYRLDSIRDIILKKPEPKFEKYRDKAKIIEKNLWGVAIPARESVDHIEIVIRVENGEEYILSRMEREKRNGEITPLGDSLYLFTADVCDAAEMLPWIRTFIGRISDLRCSNKYVEETFYEDLKAMEHMYGVDADVVL